MINLNGGGFRNAKMPKSVTCYICGRGYGTKSIKIHLKTCIKKWDIEQSRKPKRERRPCPQPPRGFDEMMNKKKITRKDLDIINSANFSTYNQNLIKCSNCNRTFKESSYKSHSKVCKKLNFKKIK